MLKSWAITRGPSLVAGEKRLAVQTEDHPIAYLDFEGNIPRGEYGGGAMIIWDQGRWRPESDPHRGLEKGHLEFSLAGERLNGRWHLVRMRRRPQEKKEQWLLIKADDEFARPAGAAEVTLEETTSSVSGRTAEEVAASGALRADHAGRAKVAAARRTPLPDAGGVRGARKGLLPARIELSFAKPSDKPPSGAKWVHEIKLDGYRLQARIDGRQARLLTRAGLDWTERFPTIAAALQRLGLGAALLDGEIIVADDAGIADFGKLQAELAASRDDHCLYVLFDLLYLDGWDLTNATLIDRKALLQEVVASAPSDLPVRFSEHLEEDGPTMLRHACQLGLEGIVSKRADLGHRPGRGDHWLKAKCLHRQEFIIVGYWPSTAVARSIGSLLVGYHDRGRLLYAGRVGSGYSSDLARTLRKELDAIAGPRPAFANPEAIEPDRTLRWVDPRLVCDVEFRGWTADRLLRQASFKGLREDKSASEVVLEQPPAATEGRNAAPAGSGRLTHPERILWEAAGITKQGLAEFYADIADWLLPHVAGRALSLVRCPSGTAAKCFFAKHAWQGLSDAVRQVDLGDEQPSLVIDDLDGVIDLVQAAVAEIHPWGSRADDADRPDRLIFDLDPGEDVAWAAVIESAREVRRRLEALGLESFVKTSGGKGLHVVLPIVPEADWDMAKEFTASVASAMARDQPDRYVAIMTKQARRGRIFVDYFRNGRGATAVAAYSTRQLPEATVSTPLDWDELSESIRADHFKIANLRQRLRFLKRDPWHRLFEIRQRLPAEWRGSDRRPAEAAAAATGRQRRARR